MAKRVRKIYWIAGLAIVGAAAFLVYLARMGDAAERQTISISYLSVASQEYIQTFHQWPGSWEDLAKARPSVGQVTIPRDQSWVEKQVFFDFHARLEDVAQERSATFKKFGPRERPLNDYSIAYQTVISEAAKVIQELNK